MCTPLYSRVKPNTSGDINNMESNLSAGSILTDGTSEDRGSWTGSNNAWSADVIETSHDDIWDIKMNMIH